MSGGSTMELIFYVIQLINKNRENKVDNSFYRFKKGIWQSPY